MRALIAALIAGFLSSAATAETAATCPRPFYSASHAGKIFRLTFSDNMHSMVLSGAAIAEPVKFVRFMQNRTGRIYVMEEAAMNENAPGIGSEVIALDKASDIYAGGWVPPVLLFPELHHSWYEHRQERPDFVYLPKSVWRFAGCSQ